MVRRGQLRQLGSVLYRLYVTAYMMLLGFAFLGDLSGDHARPRTIDPRTTAAAGAVLVGVVFAATWLGRVAVALRPSPAEVQLALLSPVDRPTTLARPIGLTATASIFAASGAALVLMLVASPQFAGLSVGIQLTYVVFAAGVGLVAYGGHLLVAERKQAVAIVGGAALVAMSSYDVVNETSFSPATAALRGVRGAAPFPAVAAAMAVGIVLAWRASVNAEAIELEKISRGGDLADTAIVAAAGNDVRSLLILQRSMGVQPWRRRPLFSVSKRLARRLPVFARALRNVARWRIYRWLFVAALATAVGGLLRVQPSSVRTIGLAAAALWLLGLAVCEPFAQEHDRADRLATLPMARRIEFRQLATCASLLFVVLAPTCLIALAGRATVATALTLALAAACGATAGGCISLRRVWKPMMQNPAAMEFAGAGIALTLVWPVLVAAMCLGPWAAQARGATLLMPSAVVALGFVFWIRTGGLAAFTHRLAPQLFPSPT